MSDIKKVKDNFKNKELFDQALTHRSWVNENPNIRETNERLEFLGDAILEFVVSKTIFSKFPTKEEGFMTALRANLVNTKNLAGVGETLGIGKLMFLSKGEEEGLGRENPSLLADTMEAIIGAIYIDQGVDEAEEFINKNILNNLEEMASQPLKDAKSLLQELVQARGMSAPNYKVLKEEGPDHNKIFTVEVIVDKSPMATSTGKSKSEAAQNAAQEALYNIEQNPDILA